MLRCDMRSFRTALLKNRWPVRLVLAIFLGGTNYCVAVAIAGPGAGLACGMNAMASASSEASAQSLPPCHAHAAKAPSQAPSKNSPKRGPMPCCITLAPSSAPPDAKPAVEMARVLPPGFELAVMPLAPWTQAPIELDTGPPERPQAGSLSSRAPPLA